MRMMNNLHKSRLHIIFAVYVAALFLIGNFEPAYAVPQTVVEASPESIAQRPSQWAVPVDTTNNLYRISPTLYRSAKLNKDMLPELQQLGIRTVINLRAQHDDEKVLRGSGIQRVDIPMRAWNISDEKVVAALKAIRQAEKQGPVLFHCQHGADRTGVVAAMYRIIFQGWSREDALTELQDGDYGFHSIWVNIPRYVREVDVERVQQQFVNP